MDHSEGSLTPGSRPEELRDDEWVQNRLATLRPPAEWQPNVDAGLALLNRGQRSAPVWHRTSIYALLGVAVAGSLLVFPVTRVLAQRCVDACVAGTTSVGQFLGIRSSSGPDHISAPITRKTAPEFKLQDAEGRTIELANFRGKVVLLNFWATWCGPCKVEIPWFMEFQQRFRDARLTVLGVSMDEDGWKSVRPFVDERKVNYRVMVGDDELTRAYGGIEALPMTFLIDKSGRIAATHMGLVTKATYEDEINRLMAE